MMIKDHNELEVVLVCPRRRPNQRTLFIKILTYMFIRCLRANIKCLPTEAPLAENLCRLRWGEIQERLDIIFLDLFSFQV